MKDQINPDHYKGTSGIQAIDAMQACSTEEEFKGFLRLTAMKYLWRLGKKDHPITEGKKAVWYIEKLIDLECDKSKAEAEAIEKTWAEASYPPMTVEPVQEIYRSFHFFPVEPVWMKPRFDWNGRGWYIYESQGVSEELHGPLNSYDQCKEWVACQ